MCLLFHCRDAHADFPFILLANRDEFYARPSEAACFWHEAPEVLAGRDLRRGGTWMGITRGGKWAALTNYREPSDAVFERSRGDIAKDYLTGATSARDFAASLRPAAVEYDGFNLLFGDHKEAYWLSNRSDDTRSLGSGIYGLSNHLLETPWPKVAAGKQRLARLLREDPAPDRLFEPLADPTVYSHDLPHTGVAPELERMLSSAFIAGEEYGTRSSTLVMVDVHARVYFEERTYDNRTSGPARPDEYDSQIFRFRLDLSSKP